MTELLNKEGILNCEDIHNPKLAILKIEDGDLLPTGGQLKLTLVKGGSESQEGITSEQLLGVVLGYLQGVNVGEFRNRDTSLAITHIEDALLRINNRVQSRKKRGVFTQIKP